MFVSRGRYEDMRAQRDAAQEQVRGVQRLYASLLDKYHALKVTGAHEPAPAPHPLPRTKASAVDEVIGTVAGSNSRLRKQLKDFAVQQRFAGEDEQTIAHALLNWQEDDAGVPE